jgi:leucyl aminopeptidase
MKCSVKTTSDPLRSRSQLLLVTVGASPGAPAGILAAADDHVGGAIGRAIADGEVRGKAGEATVFHAAGGRGPRRVAVVGVGKGTGRDDWQSAGQAFAKTAAATRATDVTVALPEGVETEHAVALIEGVFLGDYRFERFKKTRDNDNGATRIASLAVTGRGITAAQLASTTTVMERTSATRDLANTPANHLDPQMLADYAKSLAAGIPGLTCRVLGVRELERLGAGALLAVGQGSAVAPRMIVMRWKPEKARRGEVLGIVGKAVTFDTGGISIKPSAGMEEMKLDMSGGAITIESIAAIAQLGLPLETLAVIPAAENMPSGTAIKPGDVVTAMNGKTIEVVNTDAEGRLILADGLTYAARNGATRIIEFATLTGAMVVALGEVYAGLFGSDAEWTETVRSAAEASGDIAWPMPLHERYRPLIASGVADLSNAAKKRQAGAVYAAMFLREFTEGVPWCHLDIAGTASSSGASTGYGIRLVTRLAEKLAAGK